MPVRPSVCLSVPSFSNLIQRAVHAQRDSLGDSMRRGQRTFSYLFLYVTAELQYTLTKAQY